jgi:hypothetical protein
VLAGDRVKVLSAPRQVDPTNTTLVRRIFTVQRTIRGL